MRRVLPEAEFRAWFDGFLPDLEAGEPKSLFTPAFVSDRSDGKIAHLDGVNLSRAWCWRGLADALDPATRGPCAADRRHASRRQPALRRRRLYGRALAGDFRPAGPGDATMTDEDLNVAYLALGRLIAKQCPQGFASAAMALNMDEGRSLLRIHYEMPDGAAAQAPLDDDAARNILESLRFIRGKVGGEGEASWRTCHVTLRAGGHFAIEFE